MKHLLLAILCLSFILGACSPEVSSPPLPEGHCAYRWATQALPELSAEFEKQIQALDPRATAQASAFGEECVQSNGSAHFAAMETDFHVVRPTEALDDYAAFGNWVARVMAVVESLPAGLAVGPQPGFVEFTFRKSETEILIVRVPIQEYREKSVGKSGEDLFRAFYDQP